MSWIAAAGAIGVAAALVLLPGLAVAVALRLRGLTALALAGPLGYAVLGVSGVLFALVHVRFGWWSPITVGALAAVLVLALRRLLGGKRERDLPPADTWRAAAVLPVVAAALVSSVAIGVLAFGAVPHPERISQTYDAVFHLNAAQSILQDGNGSSLQLYTLVHPTKTFSFYPAVWHDLVAATALAAGVPVTVATNAAWIATAGPVWSLGCAFLAATLFGRVGLRGGTASHRTAVAAAAALLASGFTAFPYLLLDFGTLYPNGLAYTTLPVGLALTALALPWASSAPWRPDGPAPRFRILVLLAAWGVAAGFAHPRSIVGLLVLALPLTVAWFSGRVRATAASGSRGRRRARITVLAVVVGVLLLAAAATVFVYHYYDVANRPVADHLNGGPARAREPLWQALLQGLLSTSLVSPSLEPLPIPLLLAVVVLLGLVALLLRPGLRWPAVAYLIVVVLYASAAGSDSDLAKVLTGLWDKDKFRIVALLPTLGVPVAAWAVVAGAGELTQVVRRPRLRRIEPGRRTLIAVGAALTVLVAVSAWAGGPMGDMRAAIGQVFSLPTSDKNDLLIDADQTALLQSVGRYVPAGQVIIDDPWNGSALAWALGGRQTLFPHLGGYWGKSRATIAKHLNAYKTNPKVCTAVRKLDLHWVVSDKQKLYGGSKEAKAFKGIDKAVKGKGVLKVASVGSSALYRLTACWPPGT
ncbi:DUF6541 family protein [uncultured Amnibacterium sp.]|uniref:DUF6541 family protein n=1 Tax=uncultured Amnibacterium sp. TaxID=1631851 RepID=UPI0035CA00F9